MRKSVLLFLAVLSVATLSASVAFAEDAREVKSRALFAKGEYQSALDIYAKLFAEKADPLYLRNIGRCYQKLRQPDRAIDAFREYLRRARVKAAERAEIEGFIHEMEDLQKARAEAAPIAPPRAAAPAPPPPTEARAPLPPPPMALPAVGGGEAPGSQGSVPGATLSARNGGGAPVDEPRSLTGRWWFWTGIGVVVAGGVVAAIALGSGGSAKIPSCPTGVTCPR
jgi:hypothetical protein